MTLENYFCVDQYQYHRGNHGDPISQLIYIYPSLPVWSVGDQLPTLPVVVGVSDTVGVSDSEEEVDFGFWEKAPDPASSSKKKEMVSASDNAHPQRQAELKEADLGLL